MRGASLLVFTDLDGTLLDEVTYAFEPARPALAALRERGVPLVLCSSKTRGEMEALAVRLGLDSPLVVENGGAVVAPADLLPAPPSWARRDGDRVVLPLGVERRRLLSVLPDLAGEAGVEVRPFARMTPSEVARLTGLDPEAARLSLQREYDEPFVLLDTGEDRDAAVGRLEEAARRRGLRVTHGGRLHHLTGPTDKGRAVRTLCDLRPARPGAATVGLGDAANDLPMLREMDRPIVMPKREGGFDPVLAAALPNAERATGPGPAGWSAAVLAVLAGQTLPGAAA